MKERRKKHKKFSWKHTIMYTATYAVVTFCVALFMVLNTSTTLSSGQNKLNFTVAEPSVMETVISSIIDSDDITINANINVTKDEQPYAELDMDASVQFGEELTDITLGAKVNASFDKYDVSCNLYYADNMMYVSMLDGNYKIESSSLLAGIGGLTKLVGVDLSSMMSSFDPAQLGNMLDPSKTIETENGYILPMTMSGITLNLYTDKDYNLQKATLNDIVVDDYLVSGSISITNRNSGAEVIVPNYDWVDLTESVDILSALANTLTKELHLTANISYDNITFTGNINLDVDNLNVFGSVNYGDISADLVLEDSTIYIDIMGIKTKVDVADYKDYIDAIKEFGIDINQYNQIDVDKIITSLAGISLDVLQSISRVEDIVTITLTNGTQIVFDVQNEVLHSISTNINGVQVELQLNEGDIELPEINKNEYFDAKSLLPFASQVKQIIETRTVEGEINVTLNNTNLTLNVLASFDKDVIVHASTIVNDMNVNIDMINENLYINIDGMYIVTNLSDILTVLDIFNVSMAQSNTDINISDIANGVAVDVIGSLVNITTDGSVFKVSTNFAGIDINASLQATDKCITNIDTTKYYYFDVIALATQVSEMMENGQVDLSITLEFGGKLVTLDMVANFQNGLVANLYTQVMGYNISVYVKNQNIYINVADTIKLYGNLCDLPSLITDVMNAINGKSSTMTNVSNDVLSYDGNAITININGINAKINLTQGKLTSADVIMNEINAHATINTVSDKQIVTLSDIDKTTYTNNITSIVNYVSAIKRLMISNTIMAVVEITIDGKDYSVEVNYSRDNNAIELSTVVEDVQISVVYYDGTIYLTAGNFSYYFDIADISEVKDILKSNLGLNDISELTNAMLGLLGSGKTELTFFSLRDNLLTLQLNNEIYVSLTITNGKFTNIRVIKDNLDVVGFVMYSSNINFEAPIKDDFVNLMDNKNALIAACRMIATYKQSGLQNIYDSIIDIINSGKINATLTFALSEPQLDIVADITADLYQGNAHVSTYVMDYKLDIYLQNSVVYINFADAIKMYGKVSELPKLITSVMSMLNKSTPKVEFNIDTLLQSMMFESNTLRLALGDVNIAINFAGQKLNCVSASNNTFSVNVKLNEVTDEFSVESPSDITEYTNNLSDVLTLVKPIIKLVTSEHVVGNVTLNMGDSTTNLTLNYINDGNIRFSLDTLIKDQTISISYINKLIYVDLMGYKGYYGTTKTHIDGLKDAIATLTNKSIDELIDKLMNGMTGGQADVKSLPIKSLTFNQNTIVIVIDDVTTINIYINGGSVTDIVVKYDSNSINIELDYTTYNNIVEPTATELVEYVDLYTKLGLLDSAAKLINTYDAVQTHYTFGDDKFTGYGLSTDAQVRFGNTLITGHIEANIVPTMENGNVVNKLYATIDATLSGFGIKVYLVDTTVYVDVQGLRVQMTLDRTEIDYILAFIETTFGKKIDISQSNSINVEMPNLSNLTLDGNADTMTVTLDELIVNTTKFENIWLNMCFEDNLDSLIIGTNVYDSNMTDLGSNTYKTYEFDNEFTFNKNLVVYLDNIVLGQEQNRITYVTDSQTNQTKLLLDDVSSDNYTNYRKVFTFISDLLSYFNKGEFAFNVNVDVLQKNLLTNTTKQYLSINDASLVMHNKQNNINLSEGSSIGIGIDYIYVNGSMNMINANYKEGGKEYINHTLHGLLDSRAGDNNFYFTYDNNAVESEKSLNLKINTNTLLKLVSVVLHVMNVDLGGFDNIVKLPDVSYMDVSNLQRLFNIEEKSVGSDFEEIDSLISIISGFIDNVQSLEFTNKNIDGKEVNTIVIALKLGGEIMELTINMTNDGLSYIGIQNLAISKTLNMSMELNANKFSYDNSYNKSASHIDLSKIDDLIDSFVNNSNANEFHITGTLNLKISIIYIININWNIPYDVQVKLVKDPITGKPKTEIQAVLGEIPVMSGVNNDVPDGTGKNRMLYVYYKDGYLYTYRTETLNKTFASDKTYAKSIKQKPASAFGDIMGYLQYCLGFEPWIMTEIEKAIASSLNRENPIDMTNVINDYKFIEDTSDHNIIINLAEIANNTQLDTGDIDIYTNYYNGKKYIDRLDYELIMPVGGDAAVISIISTDTKLQLPTAVVDMNTMYNYINSYNFPEDEYWDAVNGAWGKAADKTYTITFNSRGGAAVDSITNKKDTPITLPTLGNMEQAVNGVTYKYSFVGWCTDEFAEGDIVNWTTQPYGNKTLYAKWNCYQTISTIHFDTRSNGQYSFNSMTYATGTAITLPTITGRLEVQDTGIRYIYSFGGWTLDAFGTGDVVNYTTMPLGNITLYAKWNVVQTIYTYCLSFAYAGDSSFVSIHKEMGQTVNLNDYVPHKHDTDIEGYHWGSSCEHTVWTFQGWYSKANGQGTRYSGTITLNSNIELYAYFTSSTQEHSKGFMSSCGDSCIGC